MDFDFVRQKSEARMKRLNEGLPRPTLAQVVLCSFIAPYLPPVVHPKAPKVAMTIDERLAAARNPPQPDAVTTPASCPSLSKRAFEAYTAPSVRTSASRNVDVVYSAAEISVEMWWLEKNRAESLRISAGEIDATGAQSLAECLTRLPWLKELDLEGTSLGDEGYQHVCPALAKLSQLRTLSLKSTRFGCESAALFATALPSLTSLTSLDVSSNYVIFAGVAALYPALQAHPQLQELRMSNCNLDEEGGASLGKCLVGQRHLRVLDVSSNVLCPDGANEFAPYLEHVAESLEELNYTDNELWPDGCEGFAVGLEKLTKLKKLLLWGNDMSDKGFDHLAPCIAKMTDLETLTLSECSLASGCYSKLCFEILPNLSKIRFLDLRGNQYDGSEDDNVPNDVGDIQLRMLSGMKRFETVDALIAYLRKVSRL